MKKIFLLGVAINHYPDSAKRLKGCINDRDNLFAYIHHRYRGEYKIVEKKLTDEKASRKGVIAAFNHFKQAQDGDICLFFFAGHGSQIAVGEAFSHLEADQLLETLVCHDSRESGGRDLIDKELSYLIWSITSQEKKDIHFVAIMDCCHSGSNTRDELEENVVARRRGRHYQNIVPESLLGYEYYKHNEDGTMSPPRGRHIMLAAAQSSQTAKEVESEDGNYTGAFSYCLLEALRLSNRNLSYKSLISRVQLRLKRVVRKQSPQLESFQAEDKDLIFLTGKPIEKEEVFLLSHHPIRRWVINAGAIAGIKLGTEDFPTLFKLNKGGGIVKVIKVLPDHCQVEFFDSNNYNKEQVHEAQLIEMAVDNLEVGFADDVPSKLRTILQDVYQRIPSPYELSEKCKSATYLIRSRNNQFWLSLPTNHRPLFKRLLDFSEENAVDFLKKTRNVARWHSLLQLSNPVKEAYIPNNDFKIELARINEVGCYEYDSKDEAVEWNEPFFLSYQYDEGNWYRPAFRLKIRNNRRSPIWVSVLYLEDNFGISNELLPGVELGPYKTAKAEDNTSDYPTDAIQVWLHEIYHQWGVTMIEEYVKIIISTADPQTDDFNQEGLPYDVPIDDHRSFGIRNMRPAWTTQTITLQVHYPLPLLRTNPLKEVAQFGLGLLVPEGFSARFNLECLSIAVRHLSCNLDDFIPQLDTYFRPYSLNTEINTADDLSVLLLYQIDGHDKVSDSAPIRLVFHDLDKAAEKPIPCTYDPINHHFTVLKHRWDVLVMELQELPEVSPSIYSGLGSSVKVFMHDPLEEHKGH